AGRADVRRLPFALALVVRRLPLALAADALVDGVVDFRRVVDAAQADVHDLDAVVGPGPVAQCPQEPVAQLLALLVHAPDVGGDELGADQVLHRPPGDFDAEVAADALGQARPGAVRRADGAVEAVDAVGVGDAPADVGVDGQRLVDGVAVGV